MEPGRPRPASNWTKLSIEMFLGVIENFHNFLYCIPIARSGCHTEELLDFTEVTDRFHLSTIETQDESVLDRDYFQQPVLARGEIKRERRRRGESFGQHIDESGYVLVRGLSREWVR